MFSFASSSPKIYVKFDGHDRKKKSVTISGQSKTEEQFVYNGQEVVSGSVEIVLVPGKTLDHLGIKIEMIGQIDLHFDRGNSVRFTSPVRELEIVGQLEKGKTYPFEFSSEKPFETYSGINVRLRYFVRVTVTRAYNNNVMKEVDFAVENAKSSSSMIAQLPSSTNSNIPNSSLEAVDQSTLFAPIAPIKMEVGIEDCLHIEFEYNKHKYHTKDVILGKINFLLVRIKIKHMELAVIRREASGSGKKTYNESENLLKYDLMDGAPVKGECVPIRLYLSKLNLTPTYRAVNNVFSVKYYINLVLVDEEDRRYFKQQEIVFWRLAEDEVGLENNDSKRLNFMTSSYNQEKDINQKLVEIDPLSN
jgi:vacuolar protein sorting-associated protein 26